MMDCGGVAQMSQRPSAPFTGRPTFWRAVEAPAFRRARWGYTRRGALLRPFAKRPSRPQGISGESSVDDPMADPVVAFFSRPAPRFASGGFVAAVNTCFPQLFCSARRRRRNISGITLRGAGGTHQTARRFRYPSYDVSPL